MPGPVSETDMRQQLGAVFAPRRRSILGLLLPARRSQKYGSTCNHTVPKDGVYFQALSNRFENICCTLNQSKRKDASFTAGEKKKAKGLACQGREHRSANFRIQEVKLTAPHF